MGVYTKRQNREQHSLFNKFTIKIIFNAKTES